MNAYALSHLFPKLFLVDTATKAEYASDMSYLSKRQDSIVAGMDTSDTSIAPITYTQRRVLRSYVSNGGSKPFLDFVSTKRSKPLSLLVKSRVFFFGTVFSKYKYIDYAFLNFLKMFTFKRTFLVILSVILI